MKILRYIGAFLLIIVAFAGPLALVRFLQIRAMIAAGEHMTMPPTVVTAAPVAEQVWENQIESTGSLAAVQGVTVAAEMAGKVAKIAFEPGATVKAGDLLVQIDTSTEEAQLAAAKANADLARANLKRAQELRQNNTNSPAELDAADAQAKAAEAQVKNIEAVIGKKTIRAPFDGRLGLRLVNLGQILRDGDAITTLQTLDPIYVNFSLPQQRIEALAVGQVVRVKTNVESSAVFEGKINAINPEVDPITRNVRVQATLTNQDDKLRPGMFANVEVVLPEKQTVLAIPATAVLYAPYGDEVFVVEEAKDSSGKTTQVVHPQVVRLGATQGDFVAVVDGLKAGQTIVTSGTFKLRGGMPVVIDNKLAPKAELNPKPENS